jgi:hypothetical protein
MIEEAELKRFAAWVSETAYLFKDQISLPREESILHVLMDVMVKRKQMLDMRAEGEWGIAALYAAEAQTYGLKAVLFAGLNARFGDEKFDLEQWRQVKAFMNVGVERTNV